MDAIEDALRALAVHPVDYLVVPRTLAMMLSMPLLVAECIGIGIVAGYFVAIFLLEVNGTYYVANMVRWTQMRDIVMGLSKAFCFALLIVFISCHKGLTAREGAVGVGQATTEAVVSSSSTALTISRSPRGLSFMRGTSTQVGPDLTGWRSRGESATREYSTSKTGSRPGVGAGGSRRCRRSSRPTSSSGSRRDPSRPRASRASTSSKTP
jgi:hypothetical protein